MTSETRLRELAGAYGAQPRRWPDAEREGGLRFIAASPERAQAILSEARALDAALESARAPEPDIAAFNARLAARLSPAVPRWAGMAAALALTTGLGVGWLGAAVQDDPAEAYAYELAFSAVEAAETGWIEDGTP